MENSSITVCESDNSDCINVYYKILKIVNLSDLRIGNLLTKDSLRTRIQQEVDIIIIINNEQQQ